MSQRHLTAQDRDVIAQMSHQGQKQQAIGQALGVSQSAISRELSRNVGSDGYYRAIEAHCRARVRRRERWLSGDVSCRVPAASVCAGALGDVVVSPADRRPARTGWSRPPAPGQSRDDLSLDWDSKRQGHQWHLYLRQGRRRHRKRGGPPSRRGQTPIARRLRNVPRGGSQASVWPLGERHGAGQARMRVDHYACGA